MIIILRACVPMKKLGSGAASSTDKLDKILASRLG